MQLFYQQGPCYLPYNIKGYTYLHGGTKTHTEHTFPKATGVQKTLTENVKKYIQNKICSCINVFEHEINVSMYSWHLKQ